ncbi:MAG TPA: hypothetical protein VHP58_01580 [Alphaproteobacteria bacterium]|nr:hypothetical protein [Alphaproteobacteria bacterium]
MNIIKRPNHRAKTRSSKQPLGLLPKAGLAVAAVALGAVVLEGGARLLERNNIPAAYVGSPYYSATFEKEMRAAPGGWHTPVSSTLVVPNTYHGRWFNTQYGQRITFGQPNGAPHTVWLLGGSAVYNGEVPDAFTMASQLQNLVNQNEATKGQWKVENLGARGVHSAQELERLKMVPLKQGDIVVFYDGAADALHGVFYNNATPAPAAFSWRSHLALARLLPAPSAAPAPAHLADAKQMTAILDRTISTYGTNLDYAASFARKHDARFVQVLQPMLFSQPTLSDAEKALAANTALVPPGTEEALRAAYAQFKVALPSLAAMNGWEYADFSPILNGTDEYYLNATDTTERASALVAGYLYKILFRQPGA